MAYVLKVEYDGVLRRVLTSRTEDEEYLSFAEVEGRIREVFKFPSTAQLKMTYRDKDGDIVTLANDQDLTDACIIQELNPLRLQVTLLPSAEEANKTPTAANSKTPTPTTTAAEDESKSSFKPEELSEIVERLVGTFESVFSEFFPPHQIPEILNHIGDRVKDWFSFSTPLQTPHANGPTNISSSDSHTVENSDEIHSRVACDACFMNPIVGPRFKSMTKFNFDLCRDCYEKAGSTDEYTKIEKPMARRGPMCRMGSVHGNILSAARFLGTGNGGRGLVFGIPRGHGRFNLR